MSKERRVNIGAVPRKPMGKFAEELGHLKTHVSYPASRMDIVTACNNNQHAEKDDAEWIAKALPEGTYQSPNEVLTALLTKV
jgi:hypothetical protein